MRFKVALWGLLGCFLAMAAAASLAMLLKLETPADELSREEQALIVRCKEAFQGSPTEGDLGMPKACRELLRREAQARELDELEAACSKFGGDVLKPPSLCVRVSPDQVEYLDLGNGYWHDCRAHWTDDPEDCFDDIKGSGPRECEVPAPAWCQDVN